MVLTMTPDHPDQPIRLLLVTNTLARGGAEAMLVRLALALDPAVVEPVVACLREPGVGAEQLAERSVPLYARLLKHKLDLRVVARLSTLIEPHQPACVMAVGNGGDRMFWSTLAARQAGAAMMVWSHIFPMPGHLTFEWINRRLYDCVDAFVALGERHREALVALERVPADRLHVIRNGISDGAFQRTDDRGQARQLLGASDETIVVGIVANLRADKRHDLFIQAAARTRTARPGCQFVIIGGGPESPRVERMVAACDPQRAFITMLGERDDVATLMRGLDIVCLTSAWQECLSVAMLEAMAAGRAFVAPRIGSLDEALIDGVTGRFVEPLTADALAEVLIELIDRPALRRSLGEQARAKVKAEFTVERMAREFEALITGLCNRRMNDGS